MIVLADLGLVPSLLNTILYSVFWLGYYFQPFFSWSSLALLIPLFLCLLFISEFSRLLFLALFLITSSGNTSYKH